MNVLAKIMLITAIWFAPFWLSIIVKMKTFAKMLFVLMIMLSISGCGSELAAGGAGFGSGFAASETLKGMQADLANREQALIARYNELVEAGNKAETLEELKQEIADTVRLRQTTEVAESVATTRWDDPKAAGSAIAAIAATAYAWIKRKELSNTVAGIKAFRANANNGVKQKLDQTLLDKKAVT